MLKFLDGMTDGLTVPKHYMPPFGGIKTVYECKVAIVNTGNSQYSAGDIN